MFNKLRESLRSVFSRMSKKGTLTEEDVKKAVREVKLALLEADVNLDVLKSFLDEVKEKAVGAEVLGSLSPTQSFVKILRDHLTALLGGERADLNLARVPSKIMVVGLNGAGKTTTAVKLAYYLKTKKGKNPLLVGCDLKRPAAFQQLKKLANSVGLSSIGAEEGEDLGSLVKRSVEVAMRDGHDVIIYDTAGRLHVDEELMRELVELKNTINPQEVLYVADSMTGQDAVNSAKAFDEAVGITGVVLTKLDGDTRGGAALSIKYVTGKPIKFAGTGEKVGDLEEFYPDRMAGRILGMGDVLSLIEEAEKLVDEEDEDLEKRVMRGDFDLNDFLRQLRKIRRMGSFRRMLSLLPGISLPEDEIDDRELVKVEAIISSMTPEERRNPRILNSSRRRRIARGSGTTVEDVNRLVRRFEEAKKMMMAVVKNVAPARGRSKSKRKKKRKKR